MSNPRGPARPLAELHRQLAPYGARDLWGLLRTPVGRRRLRLGASWLAWPLVGRAAAVYRRTVLRHTPVVAVVGSFGKGTAKRAIAAALGVAAPSGGNCWSAVAAAVLRHPAGRPLVIEVGISRPGQMRKYARVLRPDFVLVTSVGSAHRRSLDSLERTQHEKGLMVAGLRAGGLAVLNGDDELVAAMAERLPAQARGALRFGFAPHNDVRAEEVALEWPAGSRLRVRGRGINQWIEVKLLGDHTLRAVLAAVAMAHELGTDAATAAQRLAALEPTPGRMQPVRLASGAIALRDDSNPSLETVHAALATLARIPARRRIAVLGEIAEPAGSLSARYRELGERAAAVAGRILFLGHRRSFGPLAAGARGSGLGRAAVTLHTAVHELAAALVPELEAGDVVLIKGRFDQKLGRLALLLAERRVECRLGSCRVRGLPCESCPMLERGWDGLRPVT